VLPWLGGELTEEDYCNDYLYPFFGYLRYEKNRIKITRIRRSNFISRNDLLEKYYPDFADSKYYYYGQISYLHLEIRTNFLISSQLRFQKNMLKNNDSQYILK
jgi:hypothetical protein